MERGFYVGPRLFRGFHGHSQPLEWSLETSLSLARGVKDQADAAHFLGLTFCKSQAVKGLREGQNEHAEKTEHLNGMQFTKLTKEAVHGQSGTIVSRNKMFYCGHRRGGCEPWPT